MSYHQVMLILSFFSLLLLSFHLPPSKILMSISSSISSLPALLSPQLQQTPSSSLLCRPAFPFFLLLSTLHGATNCALELHRLGGAGVWVDSRNRRVHNHALTFSACPSDRRFSTPAALAEAETSATRSSAISVMAARFAVHEALVGMKFADTFQRRNWKTHSPPEPSSWIPRGVLWRSF